MSADNGVYILRTVALNPKDRYEYRVAYAQAIDNIGYYDREAQNEAYDDVLTTYFGESKVYTNRRVAWDRAQEIADQFPYLEYGISEIILNHEFPL